jgi:F0F1-type ATP synthase assembly protein I
VVRNEKTKLWYAISLALQLGFAIVLPLVASLWLGIYLDRRFKTSPWFFIFLIIFGISFTFFELRYFLLPFLRKKRE